jgi:glycine dehydrogenase subunit 1
MDYTPHTPADLEAMLAKVGVEDLRGLFKDLPQAIIFPDLPLDPPLSEDQMLRKLYSLAAKNQSSRASFLGGGLRAHHVPPVVPALATRSEFISAYTPYQPEASQGLLQAIFEYQTMISELCGLEVSNASLYDGSTALAEAVLMALRETGQSSVAVSQGVHPEYRKVLQTYLDAIGASLHTLPIGQAPTHAVGAVVVQTPNYLGALESVEPMFSAKASGALCIAVVDPISLGILKAPGSYGADIAVGEGQPLGNALAFGGPHFGFIAAKESLVRQIPGRLVSQTTDLDGKRGFILTLQAREQYIRRGKAKSNITTNAQLTALMGAVYLAGLGPEGLRAVATRCVANAHTLAGLLEGMVELVTPRPFFCEFVVRLPKPAQQVRNQLAALGIQACVPVPEEYGSNLGLFACTEVHTADDLQGLADALRSVL